MAWFIESALPPLVFSRCERLPRPLAEFRVRRLFARPHGIALYHKLAGQWYLNPHGCLCACPIGAPDWNLTSASSFRGWRAGNTFIGFSDPISLAGHPTSCDSKSSATTIFLPLSALALE